MKKQRKITMLWKFFYWPLVWLLVFFPGIIWPLYVHGILKITAIILGIFVLGFSLLLTSAGGRTLAKTGHQSNHETIWPDKFTDGGIFSCMRHPMHLGLALFPVALSLISGSVPAILSSGWGVSGALWFVLFIEEKDALNKYGGQYSAYMLRVPPFSFAGKCFKEALASRKIKGS